MFEENIQEEFEFQIEQKSGRVDKYLTTELDTMSRSKVQNLIADGYVIVNGETIKANYKLETGDKVEVFVPEPEAVDVEAEDIPLDIIYEDKDIVLVNKAQGMVVHPGAGNPNGTLVNALLFHIKDLSGINGEIRPGIVHRLDKDTSGILIVAKNDEAHVNLSEQLQNRTVKRKYWALVHGVLPHEHGTINAPIGRDPKDRQKFTVIKGGKEAISHFRVLERIQKFSLMEVSLETGRTHQIRVHLNYIDHPVAGDKIYGPKKSLEGNGQFLHARMLEFTHPRTGETMSFEAELPALFEETLDRLRKDY
ncbi:MAG TPA: RluA family pseudouridine synthase [Atopostipes sp.]|nr:RluA family pseudouridine synthase [Atopostipes sp.]